MARADTGAGVANFLLAQVASEGSATHPYFNAPALRIGSGATRNLADVAHHFSFLHGRFPGVIDIARENCALDVARTWLEEASHGFASERGALARIVVAAGPAPSTTGQAESEAAMFGQRNALETLARSERSGCAVGAAVALTLDWRAVRVVLDIAAERFGVATDPPRLPSVSSTVALVRALAATTAAERALAFGAQQLLHQHRGLWSLLEAREGARRQP